LCWLTGEESHRIALIAALDRLPAALEMTG
jgi:hypothetical protein